MSESQFEKMRKALAKAESERDLSRHTVEVQGEIINELRDEVERLRGLLKGVLLNPIPEVGVTEKDAEIERLRRLLKKCQPYIEAGISECDTQLCDEVEKEVGDEVSS